METWGIGCVEQFLEIPEGSVPPGQLVGGVGGVFHIRLSLVTGTVPMFYMSLPTNGLERGKSLDCEDLMAAPASELFVAPKPAI